MRFVVGNTLVVSGLKLFAKRMSGACPPPSLFMMFSLILMSRSGLTLIPLSFSMILVVGTIVNGSVSAVHDRCRAMMISSDTSSLRRPSDHDPRNALMYGGNLRWVVSSMPQNFSINLSPVK